MSHSGSAYMIVSRFVALNLKYSYVNNSYMVNSQRRCFEIFIFE
jgi:hypothetical protein